MYKVRQRGTEKYISETQSWAFVSSDKAHVWKDGETACNVITHCPTYLRGMLEVVALDDQANRGRKDVPVKESPKKIAETEKDEPVKENPKKPPDAEKEDFSDDIAALSGMRPENLMKLIRYAYRIRRRAPGFSHGDIRRIFSCSQLMPRDASTSSYNTFKVHQKSHSCYNIPAGRETNRT